MPLQNRATPLGTIVADPARGTMMGNRGILHDGEQRLGRSRWKHKNWVACALEFRGRKRPLMAPGHYTELFFLDEATALSAGHRPCAECRRADYDAFRDAWTKGLHLPQRPAGREIDARLHGQRVGRDRRQVRHEALAETLPDGAFVLRDETPWLVRGDRILRWTPSGYDTARERPAGLAMVLTPAATVAALSAGYRPGLHPSADACVSAGSAGAAVDLAGDTR